MYHCDCRRLESMSFDSPEQRKKEEFWNILTHTVGALFGIYVLINLVNLSQDNSQSYSTISMVVYGISFILLFSASSIYHYHWNSPLSSKLRVFDHISIYVLIAGTYTPFTLIVLIESSGVWMFYTIWGLALIGTIYKIFFTGRFRFVSMTIYLAMGWLVVLDFSNLTELLSTNTLTWMMAGGGFYTVGAVFYSWRKLKFNHAIWHFFVLAGAICHYFSVLSLVE